MRKMIFILFVVIILLSACGSDIETDSPRPAGRYRSIVDRAYQLVLEIHEDGKVTLFEQDIDSHAVDPEGRTYEGKWSLVNNVYRDGYLASLIQSDSNDWWMLYHDQIRYIWKFSGKEIGTANALRKNLYFVQMDTDGWSLIDADKVRQIGAMTVLFEEKEYPAVREEDCPRPYGKYRVKRNGISSIQSTVQIDELEIRNDGTVVLHFMNDIIPEGQVLKGRWTLWKNLEQEGSYSIYRLESWQSWNEETEYVWRFDSDEAVQFTDHYSGRAWLLFTFKKIGNIWLYWNTVTPETPYLLEAIE